MDAEGVPYDYLDASEIMRRWPQWHLGEEHHGLYQTASGLVDPNRANEVHRRLAREHGALLLDETPVTELASEGDDIVVSAGGERHRAGHVVLAADAWTNDLLRHVGLRLPLTITQEQVTYFAAPDPTAFAPERFPVWIWMDEPCFYGFPVYGEPGPKAAQDVGGREVTPESRTFDRDEAAFERLSSFIARHLPGALGPAIYTKSCLYTMPPDRDFVLDRVPGHPGLHVLLGAAHGFKFASLFGRIVAERIADGESPSDADLVAFRFDRPILLEANPPTNFMV
jgi:sarcosine oxidase